MHVRPIGTSRRGVHHWVLFGDLVVCWYPSSIIMAGQLRAELTQHCGMMMYVYNRYPVQAG